MKTIKTSQSQLEDVNRYSFEESLKKLNDNWDNYSSDQSNLNFYQKSMVLSNILKELKQMPLNIHRMIRQDGGYVYGVKGLSSNDVSEALQGGDYGYFDEQFWFTEEGYNKVKAYVDEKNKGDDSFSNIKLDVSKWRGM
jgi:hypothetical protein